MVAMVSWNMGSAQSRRSSTSGSKASCFVARSATQGATRSAARPSRVLPTMIFRFSMLGSSWWQEHGLDHVAPGAGLLGLVDLVEREGLDQLVEGEPALAPQLDQLGDEDLGHGIALEDALHVANQGQRQPVEHQLALLQADLQACDGW